MNLMKEMHQSQHPLSDAMTDHKGTSTLKGRRPSFCESVTRYTYDALFHRGGELRGDAEVRQLGLAIQ